MKIPTSSRYVVSYDNHNDEARQISVRVNNSAKEYMTHVAQANESFSSLAQRYLNDEKLYWYIADQNPHIKYPDYITPGTLVRIPLV